jgi:SAM-dependent methyltransferase
MAYDPTKYWTERGKSYFSRDFDTKEYKLQEKLLVKVLKALSFKSVLEAGCGFGRITKLMLQNFHSIDGYEAFDLSQDQIDNAKKYIQDTNRVNFFVSDIISIPGNNKYDLVLAVEVLLHVRPNELKNAIIKLLSVTNSYLVHVDWQEDKLRSGASHNFMHDYDNIYLELGMKYEKIAVREKRSFGGTVDAKQVIYVVEVKAGNIRIMK